MQTTGNTGNTWDTLYKCGLSPFYFLNLVWNLLFLWSQKLFHYQTVTILIFLIILKKLLKLFSSQVRGDDAMRVLLHPRLAGGDALLGWLLQFRPESPNLRLLQPRLSGSLQGHLNLCATLLLLLLEDARQVPLATGLVPQLPGREAVMSLIHEKYSFHVRRIRILM